MHGVRDASPYIVQISQNQIVSTAMDTPRSGHVVVEPKYDCKGSRLSNAGVIPIAIAASAMCFMHVSRYVEHMVLKRDLPRFTSVTLCNVWDSLGKTSVVRSIHDISPNGTVADAIMARSRLMQIRNCFPRDWRLDGNGQKEGVH